MEYYRPLSKDEQEMHIDRLEMARQGTAFNDTPFDAAKRLTVFNELLARERELLAPDGVVCDYDKGTAKEEDEVHTRMNGSAVLLSSEHATRHWSIDADTGKLSEPGTAALGSVVAYETHGIHTAMIGKQTGNANYQPGHPYKQHVQDLIEANKVGAFISLHGMKTGLVSELTDERPYDVLIGIGNNPSHGTLAASHTIVRVAEELGLRASVNSPFLVIVRDVDGRYRQQVYSDGTPVTNVFAAPDYTTRAAAQRKANEIGLNLPTLQIEFAGSVRALPRGSNGATSPNPIGPYLAYEALCRAIPRIARNRHPREAVAGDRI